MLTIIKLADVNGEPKVKMDLPGPLRNGDPIALRFVLNRQSGGRNEVLEVDGRFRVTAVGFDATQTPHKQLLSVDAADRVPTWRSVKKTSLEGRRLSPGVHPRKSI